jgi:hypothetical protein
MVVKMVSRALDTEADVVDPVAGGRSEKKVREGYVVICKVWATVRARNNDEMDGGQRQGLAKQMFRVSP